MNTTKISSNSNPLGAAQRETAGARTFEKYEYQYHWALCRILDAHEDSEDYVIFVELHEDVVLATSTDENIARFEFNQIKSVKSPPWNTKKLVSIPRRNLKNTNSILGKMIQGVRAKPFINKLDSINLVVSCGFNLPPREKGLRLSIISIDDLHDDCIKDIQNAIDNELGTYPLPNILKFITPDLPSSGFQNFSIGKISELVDLKAPGSKCSASTIYRILIDDLHRKGIVAFDFTDWHNLVKNKGITQNDVEKIISTNTENRGIEIFLNDLDSILDELGLKINKRMQVRRAFERYHITARFERTLIAIDNQQTVRNTVELCFSEFMTKGAKEFMSKAIASLPKITKRNLIDLESIQAAIIYELLRKHHEE